MSYSSVFDSFLKHNPKSQPLSTPSDDPHERHTYIHTYPLRSSGLFRPMYRSMCWHVQLKVLENHTGFEHTTIAVRVRRDNHYTTEADSMSVMRHDAHACSKQDNYSISTSLQSTTMEFHNLSSVFVFRYRYKNCENRFYVRCH